MALAWSAALNPTQISRVHGTSSRDGLVLVQEQKGQYGFYKLRQNGIRPKKSRSIVLYASIGETVEDKGTDSSNSEEPSQKSEQADATKPPTLSTASPFVGAKISSRIAARAGDTNNGRGTASTKIPTTPTSFKSPFADGLPPFSRSTPSSQASSTFSPKPSGPQTFSPKPPSSQGSPFSSPLAGTEKLKGSKPSVFLDSRAGGAFKQPGPKGLLDSLRQSENATTKFGQPIVPTNLFDEPDKLTAEDKKRFDFTFNAGQLFLVFSFLTIIGVMLGTAYLVWKVGAIHYNEY